MGRGALTLFPVCAATGAQGGAAAQASGLGAVPPAGGRQARSARRLRRPPGSPQASAFFRITLPPCAPASPAPSAAPCKPQAYGPQAKPPLRGGFRRASPAAAAAPPGLRPSPPTLRPSPPTLTHSPPHPANSPKISHETIPTKIQILYKSTPQSPPFVNFP